MGAYEDNLRHVAEPSTPAERERANYVNLFDYEALWYTEHLREFAYYGDHDYADQEGVAIAYASYIDKKVRDEGCGAVSLYAHTELAANTLVDALYHHCPAVNERDDYPMTLFTDIEAALIEILEPYVEVEE